MAALAATSKSSDDAMRKALSPKSSFIPNSVTCAARDLANEPAARAMALESVPEIHTEISSTCMDRVACSPDFLMACSLFHDLTMSINPSKYTASS